MLEKSQPDAQTLQKIEALENSWAQRDPPKPDDENDKAVKQKAGYRPESALVPLRPATSARRAARGSQADALTKVATADSSRNQRPAYDRHPPDFAGCSWVRLHRTWPPTLRGSWGVLSWQARALYGLLLTVCDRDGAIHLGPMGLRAVCGFIGAPLSAWGAIETQIAELCAIAWADHDIEGQLLSLLYFPDSQRKTDTPGAQRTRAWRERKNGTA